MSKRITGGHLANKAGHLILSFIILMFFGEQYALAGLGGPGEQFKMKMNISGTVTVNGNCSFNEEGPVNVDFKEVVLQKIGSGNYQLQENYLQPLASEFACSGDSDGLLQMRFSASNGTYTTYNGIQVLPTSNTMVGLQLLVNGVAQTMGQWFDINQTMHPSLEMQVVQLKTSGSVTSGDVFTAAGTLTMAFY